MAEVSAFRGIRYNQEIVEDLANVICPPYDIITRQQQKLCYKKSNYNVIRLEYGADQLGDNAVSVKYGRAANTFQQWLKEDILQVESHPALYLHDHYFTHLGERKRRRGLIARVKLEPWYKGIYPHEETFSRTKRDRLQLMRACHANFSSVFSLYQDLEGNIATILSETSQGKPIIELSHLDENHVVWAITDPKFIHRISELFIGQSLYVADGHHRYETALAYQRERVHGSSDREWRDSSTPLNDRAAFNYVMMTLVDFSDPGLLVFPIHRLVRGIAPPILSGLRDQLNYFFALESIPLTDKLISSLKNKMVEGALLGILGLEAGSLLLLKQRQDVAIEDVMPEGHSQTYKNLNVSLLTHLILGRILGVAQDSEDTAYTVDMDEACQQITEGKYQLVFLLSALQPEIIKTIAEVEDRMPPKSTYFHPKLPTGLIINYLG